MIQSKHEDTNKMKKLNITKERFEKSNYFKRKYGKLEYVSESGNLYKTNKGKVLMFVKESRKFVKTPDEEPLYKWGYVDYKGQVWYVSKSWYRADKGDFEYLLRGVVGGDNDGEEIKAMQSELQPSDYKGDMKFTESAIEATDPALVCPYCGGNNCEVSIGTDDLNLTYFDKLDGETFNVECWCNDCNKPYNVTVELKVKNVYPNEDADELQYGDWE